MESQVYHGVNPSRFDMKSTYLSIGFGAVHVESIHHVFLKMRRGSGKLFMCIMMRH